MKSLRPPVTLLTLLTLALGSCVPEQGLNGPDYAEPQEATGPCYEADLTDGFQDGEEVMTVFSCFNQYGALDPLTDLVSYLTTSDDVSALLDAMNESLDTFDIVGGLEIMARLLDSEDAPLTQATGLFTEAVDAGLVGPGLGVAREAADAITTCEAQDNRGECSVPRLTLHLLDTEVPDDLGIILDGVENKVDRQTREDLLTGTAQLLVATSSLNTDKLEAGNDLLRVGRLMVDVRAGDEASPLEQLLIFAPTLLDDDIDGDGDADPNPDDDNLLAAMARPIAGLYRDGTLDLVPAELQDVFTHDSSGERVGYDGVNMLDELLAASADLTSDLSLLTTEITLPGSDDPSTLLDLMLDMLDGVYLSGSDPSTLITSLSDMVDSICSADDTIAICDLAGDTLPPLSAVIQTAPNMTKVLLASAYALHHAIDVSSLLPMVEVALKLDLMDASRGLLVATLENDTLSTMLPMIPVFIDTDLGRLTPAGRAAQELGQILVNEQTFDGETSPVTPALVVLPLARQLLHPEYPTADLDFLLGTAGGLIQDPDSGFYPDTLLDLVDSLTEALGQQDVDLEAQARKLLENDTLWQAGARLLADPALIDLLTPIQGRNGVVWWAYDLIETGTLDDMLSLVATLLNMLVDNGLIDPGLDSDTGAESARTVTHTLPPAHLPAHSPVAEAAR